VVRAPEFKPQYCKKKKKKERKKKERERESPRSHLSTGVQKISDPMTLGQVT
jgi:hypothetical protein